MHPGFALDWNLVRSFAAVAKAGSLAQAADSLGVSHPTITRHIHALETAVNTPLFDRTHAGLTLNPAGQQLVPIAEAMHGHALEFAALTDRVNQSERATVRVTVSEFLSPILPDLLESLRDRKDLTVELIPSDEALNLLERDADIALRHGPPQQQDLVRRKLGLLPLGLWASRSYVTNTPPSEQRYVMDASGRTLKRARELGFDITDEQVSMRCSSRAAEVAAMLAGWGIGVLPELTASRYPDLVRVSPEADIPPVPVWIVARQELKHTAAGKRVFDELASRLSCQLSD